MEKRPFSWAIYTKVNLHLVAPKIPGLFAEAEFQLALSCQGPPLPIKDRIGPVQTEDVLKVMKKGVTETLSLPC